MVLKTETPYWRLSSFYLIYFASVGALIPYWGLYLKSIGYSVVEIGEVMSVLMATKIVAPNIWGWIGDHTGKHMRIVRIASLLSALVFAAVLIDQTYPWMMLVMIVFSFFWNANLPQFEATTLAHLGARSHRYSSIRLWGSIGFILSVVVLGGALEQYGAGLMPFTLCALLTLVWIVSQITPASAPQPHHDKSPSFWRVMQQPKVIALFVVCFLLQASHGPYYTFYSIYLEDNGYSRSLIGLLWALGVVAEIIIFLFMHRLLPRFGAKRLLAASLLLSSIRWIVIGVSVQNHMVMILAQTLHAFSFGVYHAVAIHLIHQYFPGKLQGRGQALYSSLSFGAGGAVGAFYAGHVWSASGAFMAYAIAALLCVGGFLVTLKGIPSKENDTPVEKTSII